MAVHAVESVGQRGIGRRRQNSVRHVGDIGERGVGQRIGRGIRHGAWHVPHGVVNDAVQFVRRVGMAGLPCGGDAAALIDGNVHDDRAFFHRADHRFADDDRRPSTGDEYRTDHQIGISNRTFYCALVRCQRDDSAALNLIDEAQAVEVLVEQQHLGLHARGNPCGIPPHVSRAQNNHARRPHPGGASHEDPSAAAVAFQKLGPHLWRQSSRHLTHRGEQRERTVGRLHRFVGNCRAFRRQERVGHLRIRRKVEVGKEREVGPQETEFGHLRFLDFDHHVLAPRGFCGRHDVGACTHVVGVGNSGAFPGAGLYEDPGASALQLAHSVRREGDARLRRLNFRGNADGANDGAGTHELSLTTWPPAVAAFPWQNHPYDRCIEGTRRN